MSKVCLVIIDGFGISLNGQGDATEGCKFIKKLIQTQKFVQLNASGRFVGLIDGLAGNSEVGHLTIGSGRVIEQNLIKIHKLYQSGELKKIIENIPNMSKRIHLIGLLSNGGVHSDYRHAEYLNEILLQKHDVFIHAIADGIDTSPKKFKTFFNKFNNIVSVSGRYFSMDRDKNWERTQQSFDMMTKGLVEEFNIEKLYKDGIDDEFIPPVLIKNKKIHPDDTVILFNIRPDRMRQIYSKFKQYYNTYTLVEYENGDQNCIIKPTEVKNTLSTWLEINNKNQVHIAETEKYAHVTYFFNGGKEIKEQNEKWKIVNSPRTKLFSLTPGTSMEEVVNKIYESIQEKFDFIVANLAAADLVGHTGDFEKTIEACLILDKLMEKLYNMCIAENYILVITSDHGNSECMFKNNKVCKSHTTNKVPFIVVNTNLVIENRKDYSLIDIAPTILKLMGLEKPDEMTGSSILTEKN